MLSAGLQGGRDEGILDMSTYSVIDGDIQTDGQRVLELHMLCATYIFQVSSALKTSTR